MAATENINITNIFSSTKIFVDNAESFSGHTDQKSNGVQWIRYEYF